MRTKLIKKIMSSNKKFSNLLTNLYSFIRLSKYFDVCEPSNLIMMDHTKGNTIRIDKYFDKEGDTFLVRPEHIYHPVIKKAFIYNQDPYLNKPAFDLGINERGLKVLSKDEDLFRIFSHYNLSRLIVLPEPDDESSYLAISTLDRLVHKSYQQRSRPQDYVKN